MFELEMRRFRYSNPIDNKMIANIHAVFIISHEIPRRFDVRVFEHQDPKFAGIRYFCFPDGKVFWFKTGESVNYSANIVVNPEFKEVTT